MSASATLRSILTMASWSTTKDASISESEVHNSHRSPANPLEKEGMRRFYNSPPFRDPYYANVRIPDRRQHEARLREEIRRVEEILRS